MFIPYARIYSAYLLYYKALDILSLVSWKGTTTEVSAIHKLEEQRVRKPGKDRKHPPEVLVADLSVNN